MRGPLCGQIEEALPARQACLSAGILKLQGALAGNFSLLSMSQHLPGAVLTTCSMAGEQKLWLCHSASACLTWHDSNAKLMVVPVHTSQDLWLGSIRSLAEAPYMEQSWEGLLPGCLAAAGKRRQQPGL